MSELTVEQRKNRALVKSKIANTPKLSECLNHGFSPKEYNIVVAVSTNVEQKSAGGIILTADTVDSENDAAQIGRIVAVSPLAFSFSSKWSVEDHPKVGDLILYAKWGGSRQPALDGNLYRVCKDHDVMCVYDNELVEQLMGEE